MLVMAKNTCTKLMPIYSLYCIYNGNFCYQLIWDLCVYDQCYFCYYTVTRYTLSAFAQFLSMRQDKVSYPSSTRISLKQWKFIQVHWAAIRFVALIARSAYKVHGARSNRYWRNVCISICRGKWERSVGQRVAILSDAWNYFWMLNEKTLKSISIKFH